MPDPMHIFVVAGENSGDTHAASLLADLGRDLPRLRISGLGGPELHSLSSDVEDWTHEAAVIGIWDVLRRYGWFRRKFRDALARVTREKPDAVLLVDYPGFNLRLARALQSLRPGTKIIYYISPQVWAWNRGRIPRMARWLDRMLCIFPFEKDLYEQSGLSTEFVGHPMASELNEACLASRDPDLLALLPGSREREVRKIFPVMLAAAHDVLKARPRTRFAASAMSENLQSTMQSMAQSAGLKVDIGLHDSLDVMRRASAGLVASGTATLEATLIGLPYALVYKIAWFTYFVARVLVKVPHIGMANLLAGREIIREFIQTGATPNALATESLNLLDDPSRRESMLADFAEVRQKLIAPGTISPARAVLEALSSPLQ